MPLILSGNVASALPTGYDVANSCRFQDSDSSEMSRAIASTGSNTTWTVSAWVKRVELGQSSPIFGTGDGGANNDARMVFFDADDHIQCTYYNSGYTYEVTTNRLFRDVSAWYHICILFDTTESTAADRVKIFVNGVKETSFGTASYPNEDAAFNSGNTSYTHFVNDMGGRNIRGSHYIAELVYIDGTASAVTNFGEFDSDSPTIWKPIDVSGLSVGTNGVYLDFKDSANLGNAVDGGTDFTESNLDAQNQTTDTCTNNFCTLNPLVVNSGLTFSEGNLNLVASNANYRHAISTIAVQSGKWYAEFKAISGFSSVDKSVGIYRTDNNYSATTGLGNYTTGTTWSYGAHGDVRTNNGVSQTGVGTFTNGDIIAVAMDLDNNKLYFAKNNTWINSGDPESGATGTGSYAISSGDFYHFAVTSISSGGAGLWSSNFGNPPYANSSDAADANGYGAFEYAPPSGYLSLCTKNLGSDGG